METLMPYLLPLLLLPTSLYLIFFARKRRCGARRNLPPGSEGWPFLGENVELSLVGLQELVRDRMQRYSPNIFKTSLLGEKMVVLCGAEGNKLVFTDNGKLFTRWPPSSLRRAMFPDLDDRRHQEPVATFHNFQYDVLKPEALKQYVPVMDYLARRHLADLSGLPDADAVVKALPLTNTFAFEVACRVFMGVEDRGPLGSKLLGPLSDLTTRLLTLPVNLPWTAFRRAVRAGKVVRGELLRIVEERRQEMEMAGTTGEGRRDVMSKMVAAAAATNNGDGVCMSDTKVVDVALGLLIGGYYEVSLAVTIVIDFLAQLPHIYDGVLREQMEIARGGDGALTWEDVMKMKYTWNVVCEAIRLVPPGPGAFRETAAEFTYAGFTIPKGRKVYWTSHSTHKNPDYFPEPEKFDPSRFEGSGPAPYTYVPFGGGARMCPGRAYARLVILVFIHNLVTRYRFEKLIPNEKMLFNCFSPQPAHGLPLRLHPHQNKAGPVPTRIGPAQNKA